MVKEKKMVDELIWRSDVIDAIHSRNKALLRDEPYRRKRGDIDLLGVIDNINTIPTIDAELVKYGHWTYDGKHWICTNCKKIAPCDRDGEYIFSPYCHNCGARICEVEE